MVSWMLCLLLNAVIPGEGDPGRNIQQAVPGQGECTVVYFTSPHCEPCKQILPALTQLRQEGWDIRSVNAPENAELAAQYRIDSLPTVVIVATQSRKEVDRIVGLVSHEQLQSRFLRAAARFSPAPIAKNPPTLDSSSSLVVRGQSPALAGGFPMLANSMTASAAALVSNSQPALARDAENVSAQAASPAKRMLSASQAIERAAQATVRIRVDEAAATAYGTGTVVHVHGNQALVLTCGHLFRDMTPGSRLSVDLFAGTPQEKNVAAELIDFRAEDEDIGLISFLLPVRIEPVEVLPGDQKLNVGQLAFSFGCDHGQPPTRRDTKLSHINRFLGPANVEIVGAPAVGRSGGGLFDVQGRLIGVCNAADAESNEGIYAAADVIYDQLERLGLTQLFAPSNTPTPSGQPAVQLASNTTSSTLAERNDSFVTPAAYSGGNSTPAAMASGASSAATPQNDVLWPDERPDAAQLHAGLAAAPQLSANGELICIVRDAAGQSRVVTISSPSPELLKAIEQHQR